MHIHMGMQRDKLRHHETLDAALRSIKVRGRKAFGGCTGISDSKHAVNDTSGTKPAAAAQHTTRQKRNAGGTTETQRAKREREKEREKASDTGIKH